MKIFRNIKKAKKENGKTIGKRTDGQGRTFCKKEKEMNRSGPYIECLKAKGQLCFWENQECPSFAVSK